MTFRIEQKLFIRKENLIQFQELLFQKKTQKLYQSRVIKSLYFDNLNLEMFNDSIEGMVPRKKIRIRNYPNSDDDKFYFEIKNSSVEGRFKSRKIIIEKELNEKKSLGILDNQYGVCYPKLYVEYTREYSIIGNVRISIDRDIRYKDYKTNFQFNDDKVIVELKTSIKKNLDELIKDFPMERIRFSKYCFAVQELYNFQ
jgi:hypothetical protein|tara:strand:- start:108 stop:704 length:597 start_codon:yes stop_codon:yes gene_type:complete